jgi:hypothetical protein
MSDFVAGAVFPILDDHMETWKDGEVTERQQIVQLVLKAVGMAMGVCSVVLSILRAAPVETNVMLLGIGVFALGLALLNQNGD